MARVVGLTLDWLSGLVFEVDGDGVLIDDLDVLLAPAKPLVKMT
jgi:hypothetical protein